MLVFIRGASCLRRVTSCKGVHRSYNSFSIPVNDAMAQTSATAATTTQDQVLARGEQSLLKNFKDLITQLPSQSIIESYRLSSVCVASTNETTESKIKMQLLHFLEEKNYKQIANVLETWSAQDVDGMIETLGRKTIADLIKAIIQDVRRETFETLLSFPIENIAKQRKIPLTSTGSGSGSYSLYGKMNKLQGKLNKPKVKSDRFKSVHQVRQIYQNILYVQGQEHFYEREKRVDIYNSSNLTGHKLTACDYENLMTLEINHLKPDLASKWLRQFKLSHGENWRDQMTPRMWTLAVQTELYGNDRLWSITRKDFSSFSKHQAKSKFRPRGNLTFNDIKGHLVEFDLEFHRSCLLSYAYSHQVDKLQTYIKSLWNIDSNGKLVGAKLSQDSHLYPDYKLVITILVAFSHAGDFFSGVKYVNAFQNEYGVHGQVGAKTLYEQLFKWADVSTNYTEESALKYLLKESKYARGLEIELEDAKNDANFDYDGYLQMINRLKSDRSLIFDQLWKLMQSSDPDVPFSTSTYKIYLEHLREEPDETRLYHYLECLLKQYNANFVDPESFTKRSGLGFTVVKDPSTAIHIYYLEAMKDIIDLKGFSKKLGQIEPLIEKWSLDKEMEEDLRIWLEERLPLYKENLEQERQKFEENLSKEEDSFLDLI
ncbi:hypothetical protein LELG_02997 [Lodderomyces elongisporus NRRL YB-4239]|uniref:ATPase expression protein 2, mitochondrial n=1 Tax=Lodderomyces elongisporus (strain ATCC 11503 / CBS 2605 / JCM 1781 / NBRC 1676 / NRRL YB-4239) TaxID=379508 RepID=A5E060_LODEL|nr:hypothetical protein LELG_02997 [Lodderomyces elongisporus NRRL YB-4239]